MNQDSSSTGGAVMGVAVAIVIGFALLLLAADRAGTESGRAGRHAEVAGTASGEAPTETPGEAATSPYTPEP